MFSLEGLFSFFPFSLSSFPSACPESCSVLMGKYECLHNSGWETETVAVKSICKQNCHLVYQFKSASVRGPEKKWRLIYYYLSTLMMRASDIASDIFAAECCCWARWTPNHLHWDNSVTPTPLYFSQFLPSNHSCGNHRYKKTSCSCPFFQHESRWTVIEGHWK